MFKSLTLNNISVKGLERLPRERYGVTSELEHRDAILVRSFEVHDGLRPPKRPNPIEAGNQQFVGLELPGRTL